MASMTFPGSPGYPEPKAVRKFSIGDDRLTMTAIGSKRIMGAID